MKYLLPFLCFSFFYTSICAQVTLPYYSGFDSAAERVGWKYFKKGLEDDSFTFGYSGWEPLSEPSSLYHDYPVGGTQVTDDWFVSPRFSAEEGLKIDSIWYSTGGFGIPFGIDTIAVYLLIGNQDPDLATSKELIKLITDSTYSMEPMWRVIAGYEKAVTSEPIYLAFQFKTVDNWITFKIDNIHVSSLNATKVADHNKNHPSYSSLSKSSHR